MYSKQCMAAVLITGQSQILISEQYCMQCRTTQSSGCFILWDVFITTETHARQAIKISILPFRIPKWQRSAVSNNWVCTWCTNSEMALRCGRLSDFQQRCSWTGSRPCCRGWHALISWTCKHIRARGRHTAPSRTDNHLMLYTARKLLSPAFTALFPLRIS